MRQLANVLVAVVAAVHVCLLVAEIFLWNTEFGRRTFAMTAEAAALTTGFATRLGLYNGFLAAGLVWALTAKTNRFKLKLFFLACATIAGLYAGYSARPIVFVAQALPAALAIAVVLLARKKY